MNLTKTETALVLAGLRILQEEIAGNMRRVERMPQIQEIEFKRVTLEDIDDLCEHINFAAPCMPKPEKAKTRRVTINKELNVYLIPCGKGFTCLGFDVCLKQIAKYEDYLKIKNRAVLNRGTIKAYRYYTILLHDIEMIYKTCGTRCNCELHPQLIGLEGKRVKVTREDGATHSFWVGKSTGYVPIHLCISNSRSTGGMGIDTEERYNNIEILQSSM